MSRSKGGSLNITSDPGPHAADGLDTRGSRGAGVVVFKGDRMAASHVGTKDRVTSYLDRIQAAVDRLRKLPVDRVDIGELYLRKAYDVLCDALSCAEPEDEG